MIQVEINRVKEGEGYSREKEEEDQIHEGVNESTGIFRTWSDIGGKWEKEQARTINGGGQEL